MKRRDFLKVLGATGLVASLPSSLRTAAADEDDSIYDGPFLVCVHAGGGWDPTMLCDPRARGDFNRAYDDIGAAGRISYAGRALDYTSYGNDYVNHPAEFDRGFMSNEAFFAKYGSRLTVFNGVDTSTNNHDSGTKAIWSGKLLGQFPSLAALFAASRAPRAPMSFLGGPGYSFTDNIVPLTRTSDLSPLRYALAPNVIDLNNAATSRIHHDSVAERIRRTQAARMEALSSRATLPGERNAIGHLMLARSSTSVLERLELPESLVSFSAGTFGDVRGMMQQSQIAVAAFRAGLASAASLSIGGFDSHSNHDRAQLNQLAKLLAGIDYLMTEAEAAGLADKLFVVVGSDFARGPHYNSDNGKDHFTVTSMMAMGPGIEGNRVIGSTNERQIAIGVDPTTFAPSTTGTVIRPEHVHRALRSLLGIADAGPTQRYPLAGEDLRFFG